MAARKSKLTHYKIRASLGEDKISQAVYFVWARTEEQALRIVRRDAQRFDVMEIAPIGGWKCGGRVRHVRPTIPNAPSRRTLVGTAL